MGYLLIFGGPLVLILAAFFFFSFIYNYGKQEPCQDLTNRSRATASPLEGNSLGWIGRVSQPQTNHFCLYMSRT